MIGSELFVKRLYGAVKLGKKNLKSFHFVNSIEFPFGITPEMVGSNPPPISQQHDQRKLIVFFHLLVVSGVCPWCSSTCLLCIAAGWPSHSDKEALPKIFLESLRIQLLVVSLLQTCVVVQPQMLSKTRGKLQIEKGDALNVQIKLCEFVNVRPNSKINTLPQVLGYVSIPIIDLLMIWFFWARLCFFPLKLGICILNVTLVFLSFVMMVL